jgi:hypothetical protein
MQGASGIVDITASATTPASSAATADPSVTNILQIDEGDTFVAPGKVEFDITEVPVTDLNVPPNTPVVE